MSSNHSQSIAEAMRWISIISSAVGTMIIPPVAGVFLDSYIGTKCVFLIVGVLIGFPAGLYTLLQMVKANEHN